MSIEWRLYQAELRVVALEKQAGHDKNCIDILIEQSLDKSVLLHQRQDQINAVHARCEDLMKQNDELSDRIHLDLDPRIKMMQSNIDTLRLDRDAMDNKLGDIHEVLIR